MEAGGGDSFLKLRYMEYRMHSRGGRKLEPVSNIADLGHNLEGTKELKGQLLTGASCQGRLHIGLKFEEDPIVDLELTFRMLAVSLFFHPLLGSE